MQSDELIESISESTNAQSKKKKKGSKNNTDQTTSSCNENFNEVVAMLEYNFYLLEQNLDKVNKELDLTGKHTAQSSFQSPIKQRSPTSVGRGTEMCFGDEADFDDFDRFN